MQLRNISSLAVLPLALGLILSSGGQDAYAKSNHAKRHHKHAHSCPSSCPSEKDIVCTLMCEGSFKNLTSLLKKSGVLRTLEGKGQFTLFAPDDKAFWKQRKGFIADLSGDPKRLKTVLTYHVLPRKVMSSDLANARAAKTVEGEDVMLDSKGGAVEVDGALVTKADIKCRNGVIHVIDDVLMPERGK